MSFLPLQEDEFDAIHRFCNHIKLCYLRLDLDYIVRDINNTAELLLGFEQKNLLNKSLLEYCQSNGFSCPIILNVDNNEPFDLNTTIHACHNQKVVKIQWNILPEVDQDSNLIGWLLTGKFIEFIDPTNQAKQLLFLKNIINNVPISVYLKDKCGRYLFCNAYFVRAAGAVQAKYLIGKTDYDMPWAETAAQLIQNDRRAIEEGAITVEEIAKLNDGKKHKLLSTKSRFVEPSGETIGSVGISLDFTSFKKNELLLDRHWLQDITQKNIDLTQREVECINWMIKGKSAAEIAILLKLSRRTIESHINNIKYKTQCYKQFQLGYLLGKYSEVFL